MPNDDNSNDVNVETQYIVAEGPDGIRTGMSVDTFRDHYQAAGYKAVASVGQDGKEHPYANIVKELNSVKTDAKPNETGETVETPETGDGGANTTDDGE